MQTFLPYADFAHSAKVLDRQRLSKQRVENLQILKALTDPSYGWQNHPAVKMWRGHLGVFIDYQRAICDEWTNRGYKDTCLNKSLEIVADLHSMFVHPSQTSTPSWLGNDELHRSHRSNLLRKNYEHYVNLFEEGLSDNMAYVWPVN